MSTVTEAILKILGYSTFPLKHLYSLNDRATQQNTKKQLPYRRIYWTIASPNNVNAKLNSSVTIFITQPFITSNTFEWSLGLNYIRDSLKWNESYYRYRPVIAGPLSRSQLKFFKRRLFRFSSYWRTFGSTEVYA